MWEGGREAGTAARQAPRGRKVAAGEGMVVGEGREEGIQEEREEVGRGGMGRGEARAAAAAGAGGAVGAAPEAEAVGEGRAAEETEAAGGWGRPAQRRCWRRRGSPLGPRGWDHTEGCWRRGPTCGRL